MPRARRGGAACRRARRRRARAAGLPLRRARRAAAGRRSSAAAGRTSCSGGSTRASSRPTSARARLDERAGAVLVGARRPLIAFNVNLRGADLEVARAIAAVVRETGGGFPGVRALGLDLPRAGPRAGEHERRGLGGRGAARDRRADRGGGGRARRGGGRLRARRPDAGGCGRRRRGRRSSGSTASTPRACSSCACSTAELAIGTHPARIRDRHVRLSRVRFR